MTFRKLNMAENGAALQGYNNELVKCIEDLCSKVIGSSKTHFYYLFQCFFSQKKVNERKAQNLNFYLVLKTNF